MGAEAVTETFDVIVVGAGHNGLVAACYLGRMGHRVAVVEARPIVGGVCVTEELVPGFRFSSGAVVLSLLWPKIVRDLELHRHGLVYYHTGVDRVGIWVAGGCWSCIQSPTGSCVRSRASRALTRSG